MKSYLPAIAWLLVSTVLLVLPGSSFPKDDWLDKIWFDKWVHVGLFFLLTVLWCRAIYLAAGTRQQRMSLAAWIALASLVYGIGMELVQHHFISNRSFDTGDIIADAVGCVLGAVFGYKRYKKK